MDSPLARSLRLLALLQTGRRWTVADLGRRLEVAPRTVRRDVARLRTLGYDVQSHPGPGGAYTLAPSIKIPPLLLNADEVCTLVTGLLILEAGLADDSATTARAKLERLLPSGLRQRAVATAAAAQVLRHGIWYLIAYDTQREDWRLFRIDRIHEPAPRTPAPGYEAHAFPEESIQHWLLTDFGRTAQHVN